MYQQLLSSTHFSQKAQDTAWDIYKFGLTRQLVIQELPHPILFLLAYFSLRLPRLQEWQSRNL